MSQTSVGLALSEEETLALVAAAVALAVKRPHRVVAVQETSPRIEAPHFVINPWSMEGRFQHFGSHKVR